MAFDHTQFPSDGNDILLSESLSSGSCTVIIVLTLLDIAVVEPSANL